MRGIHTDERGKHRNGSTREIVVVVGLWTTRRIGSRRLMRRQKVADESSDKVGNEDDDGKQEAYGGDAVRVHS